MAKIEFKAKAEPFQYSDDPEPRYYRVKVPALDRRHCDMSAFRKHPKFGPYANSDLFRGMLARIKKEVFGGEYVRLDALPAGVTVDNSGFLAVVSVDV